MAGPIGTRIDRYELLALLGSGGFGAVYRARHVHTEAQVALKVLKRALGADPQMVERFLREARAAASVGSDHIVRVLDAGHDAHGTPFLVLELLDGVDLQGLAQREGPLPAMRVVLLCLQVLEGLEAAHQKGIVHRDMKPANAFVLRKMDERGTERDFVKLLDFGISKMHADGNPKTGLTMTGMAMGTPSYMAPEQFFDARSVDARADVYSVAAMMYELLSGKLPLDATSYADLIVKVRTEAPAHLALVAPGLPRALADALMVGLAKEKEQRWPSAREFALGLRAAMGLPQLGTTPIPPRPAAPPTPVAQAIDSESMMLGATAAPKQATPSPAPTGPSSRPPAGPGAPPRGGSLAGGASSPSPGAATPQGWVVPPASGGGAPAAPMTPQPGPGAVVPQARSSGGAMKWVLIIGGVLVASCCTCFGLAAAFGDSSTTGSKTDPPPSFGEQPPPDNDQGPAAIGDLEPVDVPPAGKTGAAPPTRKPATLKDADPLPDTEPAGGQLDDPLQLDPPADQVALGDLPTREEFIQALKELGLREDSPKFRRKLKLFERFKELSEQDAQRPLAPRERREIERLSRELDGL